MMNKRVTRCYSFDLDSKLRWIVRGYWLPIRFLLVVRPCRIAALPPVVVRQPWIVERSLRGKTNHPLLIVLRRARSPARRTLLRNWSVLPSRRKRSRWNFPYHWVVLPPPCGIYTSSLPPSRLLPREKNILRSESRRFCVLGDLVLVLVRCQAKGTRVFLAYQQL